MSWCLWFVVAWLLVSVLALVFFAALLKVGSNADERIERMRDE